MKILYSENQGFLLAKTRGFLLDSNTREADFMSVLNDKIKEKQAEYDTLMGNLSAASLPPEVVADIGEKMQTSRRR